MHVLRIAALAEALSLALLLLNLATVHTPLITSLGGPVHGTAYLISILAVRLIPGLRVPGATLRALIPGIGGLLAVRRIERHLPVTAPAPGHRPSSSGPAPAGPTAAVPTPAENPARSPARGEGSL